MHYGPPPHVVATKTNVIGLVGFWLAIASYLTCGITGVPALICSVIGMRQEPKGMALSGLLISIPAVLWCAFWLVTTLTGAAVALPALSGHGR